MISAKDLNELYQIFLVVQQNNLSGLPIADALALYENQTTRLPTKRMLADIRKDISNGISLPNAFAKHPKFFPEYIVEMMKVNEGTGQSKDIFADIVRTLEQQIDLRRNIGSQKGQIIFLIILLIAIIAVVVLVVLPNMSNMMSSLNVKIPVYTQIILTVGTAIRDFWWLAIIALVGGGIGCKVFAKQSPEQTARILLKTPLFGQILYYQAQYQFALIFGLCKGAGLDTVRALEYTRNSSNNILMKSLLDKALKDLKRFGSSFVLALQKHNKDHVMDESFYMFLRAGEKGDMTQLMANRADFYKKQLIVASQQFSNNFQQFIIVPMYSILILIIFSVLSPIFGMMQSIGGGNMSI